MLMPLIGAFGIAAAEPFGHSDEANTPEHAIRSFYRAVANDDDSAFSRLTSERFYVFDVGRRITGRDLFARVKAMHAAGRLLQWSLGPIDVHIHGSMAWAAWENHGNLGTASAPEPMSWLESAALHRSGHRWQIVFLHATRTESGVPPKP